MALYDWPINQYKFPSEGLLYQNVNPYADSMGLMSGAYSPWEGPASESGWSNPWFKGPDVTWSSPNTDYADYMQGLADAEAEAIRNANNINNPYYNNGGEDNQGPVGPNTGPVADFVDSVMGNMADFGYGVTGALGQAQGLSEADVNAAMGIGEVNDAAMPG